MNKLILTTALLTLTACGGGGTTSNVDNFAQAPVPEMKEQAKTTPDSLAGDKANARYSGEDLKGKDMQEPIPQN